MTTPSPPIQTKRPVPRQVKSKKPIPHHQSAPKRRVSHHQSKPHRSRRKIAIDLQVERMGTGNAHPFQATAKRQKRRNGTAFSDHPQGNRKNKSQPLLRQANRSGLSNHRNPYLSGVGHLVLYFLADLKGKRRGPFVVYFFAFH